MSGQVWVPGSAGAPAPPSVADFLKGIHTQIQTFAEHCQCERAVVEVLLHDGRRLRLRSISAEPGFGWVTLQPVPEDADSSRDDESDSDAPVEEALMLPLQSIVRIVMRRPDGEEPPRFGFVPPEDVGESGEETAEAG